MEVADVTGAGLRADGRADGPDRAGVVLVTLSAVAAAANLNLSVANVAADDLGAGLPVVATRLVHAEAETLDVRRETEQ